MIKRAILLLVLATAVLAAMACADDSTKLPSSKASVVLPLLKKLSTTTQPTLDEVEKIMGPSRTRTTVGMAGSLTFYYNLDDETQVGVQVYDDAAKFMKAPRPGHELICIWALVPGKKMENLYVRPLEYSN
jgi:hypothetical protein